MVNNGAAALVAGRDARSRRTGRSWSAGRAGRDRRRLPPAGPAGGDRRAAARGGHDQPHGARADYAAAIGERTGVRAEGAPVELRGHAVSRRRSASPRWRRSTCRWWPTSVRGCSRRTRCCRTSRTRRPRCAAGADLVIGERRQAARRPAGRAAPGAGGRRCTRCGATRWRGRCGRTSSRWPHWRRRCACRRPRPPRPSRTRRPDLRARAYRLARAARAGIERDGGGHRGHGRWRRCARGAAGECGGAAAGVACGKPARGDAAGADPRGGRPLRGGPAGGPRRGRRVHSGRDPLGHTNRSAAVIDT